MPVKILSLILRILSFVKRTTRYTTSHSPPVHLGENQVKQL